MARDRHPVFSRLQSGPCPSVKVRVRPCKSMAKPRTVVALEGRLKNCRNVITLGVRPCLADYGAQALALIRRAPVVYHPGAFYAQLLASMGKPTFPGPGQYWYAQDKIRQSALFNLVGIAHPPTAVFYGNRQKAGVTNCFDFPFVAKIPRGSARGRGVFLIRSDQDWQRYARLTNVAYVQRYLPCDRDIRVVVINRRVVHAYWRCARPGEFRTNLDAGGRIGLGPVPAAALELARHTAAACGFDDVGIDILPHDGHFYVTEANMKYGLQGFAQAGIDYTGLIEEMIASGEI